MSEFILGAGANYQNSLLFQLIETNNCRDWVVTRNSDFQELTNIIDVVTGGRTVPNSQSGSRELKLPYLPDLATWGRIKTGGRTVIAPDTLKLEFVNSEYDGFINDRSVEASNGTFGIVRSHGKGFIVVRLLTSVTGSSVFQSGDFAENTNCTEVQDVSKGVTGSKQTKTYTPLIEYNTIGQQRYTLELTRENVSRRTEVKINGQPYWQHAAMPLFMKETKNSINKGIWKNVRNSVDNQWVSGGIKWQIENQGGTRLTYDGNFNREVIINVAKNALSKGLSTKEYLVPCGYNVMAGLQRFVSDTQIQYVGTENTLEFEVNGVTKKVEGIDVTVYKVLGIKFKFINWAMLNNPALNPEGLSLLPGGELKSSYTAVFLDISPVTTVEYGTQPFISNYYYGMDAYYMQKIEGMTDIMGKKAANPTNSINACSIEIEINELSQLNDPSRHTLLEISQ